MTRRPSLSRPAGQTKGADGFTMIEMLVALAILATIMAVFANAAARQTSPAPYRIASEIQAIFYSARSDAIRQSRNTSVVIDTNIKKIAYGSGGEIKLPETFRLSVLAGKELISADGLVAVVFLPDGSSSGVDILLRDDRNRAANLKVNWLTGLPSLVAGGRG